MCPIPQKSDKFVNPFKNDVSSEMIDQNWQVTKMAKCTLLVLKCLKCLKCLKIDVFRQDNTLRMDGGFGSKSDKMAKMAQMS